MAVTAFETKNNIQIPDSYTEFLYLSNGARLFGGDVYLYGVNADEKFSINYDFSDFCEVLKFFMDVAIN